MDKNLIPGEELEILLSDLNKMKESIQLLNMKSAMLCIDLASLHDPRLEKEIYDNKVKCASIYAKFSSQTTETQLTAS